jgi:hypothetical protein
MRYDLFYIKNRSLWLDLRILFESVAIVLLGHGCAEVRQPAPIRRDLSWPAARTMPKTVAMVPILAESTAPRAASGRQ